MWQPTPSNSQTKNLGMTAPINTEEPKPVDIDLTKALEASLQPHGCFESDEELNHRSANTDEQISFMMFNKSS